MRWWLEGQRVWPARDGRHDRSIPAWIGASPARARLRYLWMREYLFGLISTIAGIGFVLLFWIVMDPKLDVPLQGTCYLYWDGEPPCIRYECRDDEGIPELESLVAVIFLSRIEGDATLAGLAKCGKMSCWNLMAVPGQCWQEGQENIADSDTFEFDSLTFGLSAEHLQAMANPDGIYTGRTVTQRARGIVVLALTILMFLTSTATWLWGIAFFRRKSKLLWFVHRPHHPCPSCKYSLVGSPGPCCPECGWVLEERTKTRNRP